MKTISDLLTEKQKETQIINAVLSSVQVEGSLTTREELLEHYKDIVCTQ